MFLQKLITGHSSNSKLTIQDCCSTSEVAKATGMSQRTVRRKAANGDIPCSYDMNKRRYQFTKRDVTAILLAGEDADPFHVKDLLPTWLDS